MQSLVIFIVFWFYPGKGSFGEIFLASDVTGRPVHSDTAKYVVKIEPHSNGPLFVEIHCLLNVGKSVDGHPTPPGMPEYIASGSHKFGSAKYRFLILPRFKCDLNSLTKNSVIDPNNLLVIAVQVLDVLEHLHDKGYAHSDIKAENLMIGSCTYVRDDKKASIEPQNSVLQSDDSDDESSAASYKTPRRRGETKAVQFSGSNPVRSCRMSHKNSIYQDMLSSHYLRPSRKAVNYRDSDESGDERDDVDKDKTYTTPAYINVPTPTISPQKANISIQRSVKKMIKITEDRIFLIDFGLAIKFIDSTGVHRPFCMDQRRAHDGTLEFTSRDAHMGAHSRRSDLECLGYNLIFWSQGALPWRNEKLMQQPEQVHHMKEYFMTDIYVMFEHFFGRTIPTYIGEFMKYVAGLAYHDRPDYSYCRRVFITELQRLSATKPILLQLNVAELSKKRSRPSTPKIRDIKTMMRLGTMSAVKDGTGDHISRISPKNLRSKSGKSKKQRSKFCWTDILSTDPDQIARQRAEKEYEREQVDTPPAPFRYKGNPTYAILAVENKIRFRDKLESKDEIEKSEEPNVVETCPVNAKSQYSHHNHSTVETRAARPKNGYRPLPKRKNRNHKTGSSGESDRRTSSSSSSSSSSASSSTASSTSSSSSAASVRRSKQRRRSIITRRKSGLRKFVRPTERSLGYRDSIVKKRRRAFEDDDDDAIDETNVIISEADKGNVPTVNKNNCNLLFYVRV